MKLNTNSWHYKLWAATYERGERPYNTDLCRYCHRVFWRLLLWAFMAFACCFVVGAGGYLLLYKGLYLNTVTFFEVVGVIGAVLGAIILYVRWLGGRRSYREPTTLIGKYAKASKDRVCPLVEFSNED